MSYFKFTTKEALAAWDAMQQTEAQVREEGANFAGLFGATPVFRSDLNSASFYGVKFPGDVYSHADLWTKPNASNGFSYSPRRKAPKGMTVESKALNALWNEHYPKTRLDRDPFYESLGFDWGMLLITGFEYFRHGDTIYVETRSTPKAKAGATEILGSEYKQAKNDAKA